MSSSARREPEPKRPSWPSTSLLAASQRLDRWGTPDELFALSVVAIIGEAFDADHQLIRADWMRERLLIAQNGIEIALGRLPLAIIGDEDSERHLHVSMAYALTPLLEAMFELERHTIESDGLS